MPLVAHGNANYRQAGLNQRNRPVLHLAGRVAFGVDVRNLFELERTFICDGHVDAAPEVHAVAGVLQCLRNHLHLRFAVQHAAGQIRQARQILCQRQALRGGQCAAQVAQQHCQHVQIHQRRGEGLGGGHANLRAGLHGDVAMRHARGLAADGVDNAPHNCAARCGFSDGCQRVGGFPALADGEHNCVAVNNRVGVAKFGRNADFDGQARERLDHQLAHHARVRCRAAAGDHHALGAPRQFRREFEFGQLHAPAGEVHAPDDGVRQGAHLLVNFLLHKMRVVALLGSSSVIGNGVHGRVNDCTGRIKYGASGALEHRHAAGLEENHLARVLQNCGDV